MSLIKEIGDLHIGMRYFLITLAMICPFFYLDIYFLNNFLFVTAPIQIPILMALCMSLGWILVNILCVFSSPAEELLETKDSNDLPLIIMLFSVTILLIVSGISIYLHLRLTSFLKIIAWVSIIRFLLAILFKKSLKWSNELKALKLNK